MGSWSTTFYNWFLRELLAALRQLEGVNEQEIETAIEITPQGVITENGRRPHQANLLPRPGQRIVVPRDERTKPSYGDQGKYQPPAVRRASPALIPPLPVPWFPLPPVQYQLAVTRTVYNGLTLWVPAYPLVIDDRGWARPPVPNGPHPEPWDPEGVDPPPLERVPNHQILMPLTYLAYDAAMFESNRPRIGEYAHMRMHRALRFPWAAGIRDGRRFMRVIEIPFWWVPETRAEQFYTFADGHEFDGQQFWYPRSPALYGAAEYAVPARPTLNDPEYLLTTTSYNYNTQAENHHVPVAGTPPEQSDFPRTAWDVAPNYGFLAHLLNRPGFSAEVRAAYPDPVARFGLTYGARTFRVLEVYEDNGEIVDTGKGVVGRRISGSAGRLQRTIAAYSTGNRKRVSHVVESDIGGSWRTATRWDHVVYDPDGELTVGTATVASGIDFTMSFLPADDGYPMQGRLDATYHATVSRPAIEDHRLYEGPYGALPAPGSGSSGWFGGQFVDDSYYTADVIRCADGTLLCVVVRDDDTLTVSRGDEEGAAWTTIWTGPLEEALPGFALAYLYAARPSLPHYRWMHPDWPTAVGQLFIRGEPFWAWEYRSSRDAAWRSWEIPTFQSLDPEQRCPIVIVPNGRPISMTGALSPGVGWY